MKSTVPNIPASKYLNQMSTAQAQATLGEAIALHQKGLYDQARARYEMIVRAQPAHYQALHLLGLVAAQTGKFQLAVDLIGKAIAIHPNNPDFFINLGNVQRAIGQSNAAIASYDKAISLGANSSDIYSNRGVALQEMGQLAAAVASYDKAIDIKPDHLGAICNRGIALHQLGQLQAAVASYDRAIELNPRYAESYFLRGNVLQQLGQTIDAITSYDKAVSLRPDHPQAWFNRAFSLQQLLKWNDAIASYDKAIALNTNFAQAHCNRGVALQELKLYGAAISSFDEALAIHDGYAEAHVNRGVVLQALKQFTEAVACYDKAISINAGYAKAHTNRGVALQELKQLQPALESHQRALVIQPDYAQAHSNLGIVLHQLGHLDAAINSFDKAIELNPKNVEAHSNKGLALHALGKLDAAIASYDLAIANDPNYAMAHFNKSLSLLLGGQFQPGWEQYEWRWKLDENLNRVRNFQAPLWSGKNSLLGKTILLHTEQGLGDMIQFCRYSRLISGMGARVVLEVPGQLMKLMAGLHGVDALVPKGTSLPAFDYHCPLLSLPRAFGADSSNFPDAVPYLYSDKNKVKAWSGKLGTQVKPRIGIVWSGNPDHANDSNRSMLLSELLGYLPNTCEYVSLQKDVRESDGAALKLRPDIHHFEEEISDFSDTAALCELMDLVITVDTSIAHLSGAMGKPTWILLPFVPDWRWQLDRGDSPWYPSMTLFRQSETRKWDEALSRVAASLAHRFDAN